MGCHRRGGRHGTFWPSAVEGENRLVLSRMIICGKSVRAVFESSMSRVALVRHWNIAESDAGWEQVNNNLFFRVACIPVRTMIAHCPLRRESHRNSSESIILRSWHMLCVAVDPSLDEPPMCKKARGGYGMQLHDAATYDYWLHVWADWPSLRQAGNFYRVLHCAPGFGIAATGLGKRRFDNAPGWILTTRPASKFHRMQVLYHVGVKRFFKKLSEGFRREPQRWPNAVRSILPESACLRF